jgi:hypothetical protein
LGGGTRVAGALSFWRGANRLRPSAPLPVDMPGGHHTDVNSRAMSMFIERQILRKLTSIGSRRKIQLNDLS